MQKGVSVPYASVKVGEFEFYPNTTIVYLGPSTVKPTAMIAQHGTSPL